MWKILDTGFHRAAENMCIDTQLLEDLSADDSPLLHFYDWTNPSATYGYFLAPERFLCETRAKELHVDLAKRPTGGGIIFHTCDFAFSVLIPASHPAFSQNTLDNYHYINSAVLQTVKHLFKSSLELLSQDPQAVDEHCPHFCMAKPTKYDVMLGHRKVAGAAQRRTKQGYLHQGSIAIAFPDESLLKELLLPGIKVLEAMQINTYPLLHSGYTPRQLSDMRMEIKQHLTRILVER